MSLPMHFMKNYLPIAVGLAVVTIIAIPGAHWVLDHTVGFDLLGRLADSPIVSRLYIAVFVISFLTGYLYLLVSVRSVRRNFGRAKSFIMLLIFLLSCPFGGFIAFWMRDRPSFVL